MIIRLANVEDAEAIAALVKQLGYQTTQTALAGKLRLFQQSENDAAFVAIEDHAVIGCISVHILELFHTSGRLGRITSLVVHSNRRAAGVGTALVAAAEKFFKTTGCIKAEVTSGDHRATAHRFYRKQGFVEDERRFIKVFSD